MLDTCCGPCNTLALVRARIYPDLATYFAQTGTRQALFAARVGISPSYLSRIKNRLAQPPLELALKISAAARVPAESLTR